MKTNIQKQRKQKNQYNAISVRLSVNNWKQIKTTKSMILRTLNQWVQGSSPCGVTIVYMGFKRLEPFFILDVQQNIQQNPDS
jgi:hypothetical protein